MTHKLFIAGSGGQGIMLMGQMITYAAMMDGLEVTYLPSYGPEMRGGTANCTVVVSDKPVNCPVIFEADSVVAMNLPSMTRFESLVKKGGNLFCNTSLIAEKPTRDDIEVISVPANDKAEALGNSRVANMVMLGEIIRKTGIVSNESLERVMREKAFTGSKAALIPLNMAAYYGKENV